MARSGHLPLHAKWSKVPMRFCTYALVNMSQFFARRVQSISSGISELGIRLHRRHGGTASLPCNRFQHHLVWESFASSDAEPRARNVHDRGGSFFSAVTFLGELQLSDLGEIKLLLSTPLTFLSAFRHQCFVYNPSDRTDIRTTQS